MADDSELFQLIEKPVDRRHVNIEPVRTDPFADVFSKLTCCAMA